MIRARRKTKGGRNSDPAKLAWMHRGRCLVDPSRPDIRSEQSECWGHVEVHHDRRLGSRATDKRAVRLCAGHHRLSPTCVEKLGRQRFQVFHGIDMDEETARTEAEWQAYKAQGVFE